MHMGKRGKAAPDPLAFNFAGSKDSLDQTPAASEGPSYAPEALRSWLRSWLLEDVAAAGRRCMSPTSDKEDLLLLHPVPRVASHAVHQPIEGLCPPALLTGFRGARCSTIRGRRQLRRHAAHKRRPRDDVQRSQTATTAQLRLSRLLHQPILTR